MGAHDCVDKINRMLAEKNTRVEFIYSLGGGEMIGVRTEKVDKKKRPAPVLMLASFCPFCGKKLEDATPSPTPPAPRGTR